jgi:hypothetical protein
VQAQGGEARVADTRAAPPRQKDFSGELHTGKFQGDAAEGRGPADA